MAKKKRSAQTTSSWIALAVLCVGICGGVYTYFSRKAASDVQGVTAVAATIPQSTLYLSPSSQSVAVGQTFKEIVTVDSGGNKLVSASIIASFNPAYFEAVSFDYITGNLLFPKPGPVSINNTAGTAAIYMQASLATTGKQDVAILTLRNKAAFPPTQMIKFAAESAVYELNSTLNALVGTVPATIYSIPAPVTSPKPPTPTTTPTVASCGLSTIRSFRVDTPCGNNVTNSFRTMDVTCMNGYAERGGGDTSCKPLEDWSLYAATVCKQRTGCVPSPTPVSTVKCIGQCKGDLPGTSYPYGRSCIGMDALCYVCGANGQFYVSSTACSGPTPTSTPFYKITPTLYPKVTPTITTYPRNTPTPSPKPPLVVPKQ